MSVYALSSPAQAALDESKSTIRKLVGERIITAAQGSAAYFAQVRRVIQQGGLQEASADRMIFVQCSACNRVEKLAGAVLRYQCRCSPNVDQFTFKNRTFIL